MMETWPGSRIRHKDIMRDDDMRDDDSQERWHQEHSQEWASWGGGGGNYKTKILAAANKEDCQIFLFILPHLFPRARIGGGMMDKSGWKMELRN